MSYIATNFHRKVLSHTVYLINKRTNSLGSAIFAEYNNKRFLFTALHNIEKTDSEDVFIHLGINHFKHILKKEVIGLIKNLDIAYIQLNSFEADCLRGERTFPFQINRTVSLSKIKKNYKTAVSGFPAAKSFFNKQGYNAESYLITTYPLPIDEWPKSIITNGQNPQYNFLLKYGIKSEAKFIDQDKNAMKSLIDPRGMSGGGVWIFDRDTENDEFPKYALWGIQTGIYERKELLVGSMIEPLINQIDMENKN